MVSCSALTYGDFTLASGKRSTFYIDIKQASTDPDVLEVIADEMARVVQLNGIECDRLAGVVLGSIPLAVALSLRMKLQYIMVRKEKKDHGTQRMIEGSLNKGDRVLMVEDVVTSARSVMEAIEMVRASGGIVTDVLSVVDRQEGGEQSLNDMGIKLYSLVTSEELLR